MQWEEKHNKLASRKIVVNLLANKQHQMQENSQQLFWVEIM